MAFQFQRNQLLKVDDSYYVVSGGIEFYNSSDGSFWQEYRLKQRNSNVIRWLSVDEVYHEYAIYEQQNYSDKYDETKIRMSGYKLVDEGSAYVKNHFGEVDVSNNDTVYYKEFEDYSEENIISTEKWDDETEYSKGYYLDRDEIQVMNNPQGTNNNASYNAGYNANSYTNAQNNKKSGSCLLYVLVSTFIIGMIGALGSFVSSNKTPIADYLKKNTTLYRYETSITSDINKKEKADVYLTDATVEMTAKSIISAINGKTESVQENDEDNSVAILTKNEYCLVYTNTDNVTTVQISNRAYVYQTTTAPYRSTYHTHRYYRRFYYNRGYSSDYKKYRKKTSGYDTYDDGTLSTNSTDTYQSYSTSVRQSSTRSRTSSGGGISSGK